jgi:hypothetical protein
MKKLILIANELSLGRYWITTFHEKNKEIPMNNQSYLDDGYDVVLIFIKNKNSGE